MFLGSQEDFEFTPRESQHVIQPRRGGSPARKRGRGKAFQLPDSSNNSLRFRDENDGPNGLMMSQDSPSASQFSQDFTARLGHMHTRGNTQDDSFLMAPLGSQSQDLFSMATAPKMRPFEDAGPLDSVSVDNFSMPTAPTTKGRKMHVPGTAKKADRIETEKQIDIRRPHINPFVAKTQESTEQYFQNVQGPLRKISKMWISAFKERSRYMSEFQEYAILGEGTFSAVCCARHRLDGTLYAIKKLKESIASESHGKLMLREACAFATLTDCPNLVRYFGCWIEDNRLYLQLELCHLGSLEDLISPTPSQCSIMHERNKAHYFPKMVSSVGGNIPLDSALPPSVDSACIVDTAGSLESTCSSVPGTQSEDIMVLSTGSESFLHMSSQFSQVGFSGSSSWDAVRQQQQQSQPTSTSVSSSNPKLSYNGTEDNQISSLCTPRVAHESLPFGIAANTKAGQNQHNNTNNPRKNIFPASQQSSFDDSSYLSQQPSQRGPQFADMTEAALPTASFTHKGISEAVAWLILLEVGKTLVYMHARGLVHLDLRPANFFMKAVSKASSSTTSSQPSPAMRRTKSNQAQQQQQQLQPQTLSQKMSLKDDKTTKKAASSSLFATVMQQTATATSLTQSMGNLQLQPTNSTNNNNNNSLNSSRERSYSNNGLHWGDMNSLSIQIPAPPTPTFHSTPLMTPINSQHHQIHHSVFPPPLAPTTTTSTTENTAVSSRGSSQPATQIDPWSDYFNRRRLVEEGLLRGDYAIRVGDLGLCRGVFETSGVIQEGESRYCPRELINLDHTQLDLMKSDVFSLAASVYELCLGRFLGSSGEQGMEEWHNIRDGILSTEEWYRVYSPSLTGLIGRMLHPDPKRRPSAEEVVQLSNTQLAMEMKKMEGNNAGNTAAAVSTSFATFPSLTKSTSGSSYATQSQSQPPSNSLPYQTQSTLENMSQAELLALISALQMENQQLKMHQSTR